MKERRSITVREDVNRKNLNLRAFFLSQNIEVDYTQGLNFLACMGFDEISKSGFTPHTFELANEFLGLGDSSRDALQESWQQWQIRESLSLQEKAAGKEGRVRAEKPGRHKASSLKVIGHCFSCKANREIREPVITTFKNGAKGYLGFCPVCGKKLSRVGL